MSFKERLLETPAAATTDEQRQELKAKLLTVLQAAAATQTRKPKRKR